MSAVSTSFAAPSSTPAVTCRKPVPVGVAPPPPPPPLAPRHTRGTSIGTYSLAVEQLGATTRDDGVAEDARDALLRECCLLRRDVLLSALGCDDREVEALELRRGIGILVLRDDRGANDPAERCRRAVGRAFARHRHVVEVQDDCVEIDLHYTLLGLVTSERESRPSPRCRGRSSCS